METLRKNIVVGAVLTAECPDTTGEVLIVKNADISSLRSGSAPINTEHVNPEDIEKSQENEKSPSDKGFNTIIGRVIDAKKIFSQDDCENDMEKKAWNDLKVPLVFGYVEFFDDDNHPNAKAACSLIRQAQNGNFDHMIGFSVEGNVLQRQGPQLTDTVIRRIAATMKPCNKASVIKGVIRDGSSEAPSPNVMTKASRDGSSFLTNFDNQRQFFVLPDDFGLSSALRKLKKAISAGVGNAAPSSLTGGEALQQSDSNLGKLEKLIGSKRISRESVSKALPNLGSEQLDSIIKVLRHRGLKRSEKECEEIYSKLFKNL